MLRSAPLLALLSACTGTQDSGLGGEDSADTGSTSDSGAVAADCTFSSVEPLVTSWNGGEEVTVSMDCANPGGVKTMTVSLNVARIEVTGKAVDDTTWTGTFTAPAVEQRGPQGFDLEVEDGTGTETIEGEVLRFRLDPAELGMGVDLDAGPELLGWGLEPVAVLEGKSSALVASATEDSVVFARKGGEVEAWVSEAKELDPMVTYRVVTTSNEGGAQAVALAGLDSAGDLQLLVGVDDGSSLAVEAQSLDLAELKVDGDTASLADGSISLDDTAALDGAELLLQHETDAGSVLTSMSLAADKGGTLVWTRNWQLAMSAVALHTSAAVTLSDGTQARLVFSEGSEGLEAAWIATASGKTLVTHSLKELGGSAIAITSTPVAQAKGDELAVAVLTDAGGFHVVQASQAYDEVLVHDIWAEDDTRLAGRIANGGGFRTLKPGSQIWFPPISARGTDDGGLHVALSFPLERGGEGMLLASWSGGESPADLSASPDAVELVAAGGRAWLSGGSGEKITGAPVVFQRSGGDLGRLGSVSADGSAELTVAADGGWTVTTRGGQVYVQNAEGKEMSVPLDPAAGVQARRIGEMCVLSGMVRSKSSSRWGLVTVSSEGVGTLDFNNALEHCGFDRDEDDGGMTAFCTTVDDSNEAGVGAFQFSEKELPGPGEELTLDSSKLNTWTWTSGTWTGTGTHVFSSRVAVDDSVSGDADVSSLATLSSEAVTHDVVAWLPHGGDAACPVATYFVPGASTDWSKNLASAVLLDSLKEEDCSDLLRPEATIDLSGDGPSTVLLSTASSTEGYRELHELVWDGEELLLLPAITVADWHSLEVADFDGDGLEELLIQQDPGADTDGTFSSDMSGMMLRGIGLKHLSQEIRAEVTEIKNASKVAPGADENDVVGAVYELNEGSLDALVLSGTQGRKVKKGNFTTVGVGNQPSPVTLHSWGVVLD